MVSDGDKILVGITGGIGSGKSYLCNILREAGFPVFDTDTAARNEMLENTELRTRLQKLVSPDVFKADGSLNKPVIRKFLHASPENAARFDAEVHPCVRKSWRCWAKKQASRIVFMECALLYEAEFDNEVAYTVLVTAPEDLRVERVMKRDGISAQTVRKWISMQLDEKQKMLRADYIIYNNGEADMQGEVRKLILDLSERLKRGL